MKELEVRTLVAAAAERYLGIREGDITHRKLIDLYNTQKPLPLGHTMRYTEPWCAAFVSALGVQLGMEKLLLPHCSCNDMIALYKKAGRWQELDSYLPQVGDLVFYDWDDTGSDDNRGAADHVGMVISVEDRKMQVIEGNYKNAVACRTLARDGKYIRGYALPNYGLCAGQVDTVQRVQWWCNLHFDARLQADGVYNEATKKALICALQTLLRVDADGIYGKQTVAAVKKNNLRKGAKGQLVCVLQAFLVCNGYPGAYVDGSFGRGTQKALRAYQIKKAILPDGVAGSKTFRKLCA